MATAYPLREDNFELELNRMREKIQTRFTELTDCLKARENELLVQLDSVLASYLSYRKELERVNEKKRDLEKIQNALKGVTSTSSAKDIHESMLLQIRTEMNSIEIPTEPKMVSFECNSNRMLAELNKLGKLGEKVRSGIDYESKMQPLVSVCRRGFGNQQLNWSLGVTVDNKTGNIYVADQSNNCVKVFDSTGKYVIKFGDIEGRGRMHKPRGVAIYGDRILITQSNHCILNYQLNGKFISGLGTEGGGKLEFYFPYGLTIDESNGDIYICDRDNNRVQILNKDFSFKAQIGHKELNHPRDVKLSKEYIYVLDVSNPCLHLFNYNYILQKSVITRGEGMDVVDSCFFFIDKTDNILISDRDSNSVLVFTSKFQLVHKIPVSNLPAGVTVDNQGRVIVVCQANKDCLQIF